jgi:hypothetical protein
MSAVTSGDIKREAELGIYSSMLVERHVRYNAFEKEFPSYIFSTSDMVSAAARNEGDIANTVGSAAVKALRAEEGS